LLKAATPSSVAVASIFRRLQYVGIGSKGGLTADDQACPHGVEFHYVVVGSTRHPRTAWRYEAPRPEMASVSGRFGFWQDVVVG
jgi:hypothetical protein